MDDVLSRLFHRGPAVRAAVSLTTYMVGLAVFVLMVLVTPYQVLAVQYSRVMTAANLATAQSAWMNTATSAASHALVGQGGKTLVVRAVAAGTGWPVMGVLAGLTLWSLYYNNTQTHAIVSAAGSPDTFTLPSGHTLNANQYFTCPGHAHCQSGFAGYIELDYTVCQTGPPYPQVPDGWQGWFLVTGPKCVAHQPPESNPPTMIPGAPPSATDIQNYLNGLNGSDPLAPANNLEPGGTNNPSPNGEVSVNLPIESGEVTTSVVPSGDVHAGDVVVNPTATPPAGTETTSSTSQQTTTTTTTTTNPDGSTTTQDDTSTTVQCSTGEHDLRSFGSILEQHLMTWKGSGIAGQLALLQSLTWPSDLPTISLSSSLFGNFSVNFNDWSGMFLALRAIVIAGASFAAYRIIFVGNS